MINQEDAHRLLGRDLLDRDGNRIGEITQVFVNEQSTQPTWVTVTTGWFGISESFVPVHRLQWFGEQPGTAYDTATIKAAPRFPADQPLTPRDEDALAAHYGLSDPEARLPYQRRPGDEPNRPAVSTQDAGAVAPRGPVHHENTVTGVTAGPIDFGGATVCRQCGAYISPDMNSVHETFHGSVAQPPGSYARHDIEVTEPAADVPRPAADYARHDVQVTASTGPAR